MRVTAGRRAGWAALLLCVPMTLGACSSDSKSADTTSSSTTASSSTTTTAAESTTTTGPAINSGATVEVNEFSFTPGDVTVKKGQAVSWTDIGSARHTVTPDVPDGSPEPWVSQRIAPGDPPFVVTFSAAGTYSYFCSIHPDRMQGTVTVTE